MEVRASGTFGYRSPDDGKPIGVNMLRMTYRDGAAESSLTVVTENGTQRYDLSHMNANQFDGVREIVVDAWRLEHGFPQMYGA